MATETDPKDLICRQCGGPKAHTAPRCAKCSGHIQNTPEERSKRNLCGAKKRNGELCRAYAGQGTPTPGVGCCKHHGGATGNHRKHAVTLDLKRRMVSMGTPVEDITAPEALMGLLRASAGHVAWLQHEVAALDSLAGHEAAVVVQLYDSERKMLLQVGEACIRAGVAEHIVRMEQQQAMTTLQAIRDAAKDTGLNATQLQALGVALRRRLAEASGEVADTTAADAKLAELRRRMADDEERRITALAAKRPPVEATYPPAEWVAPEPDAA